MSKVDTSSTIHRVPKSLNSTRVRTTRGVQQVKTSQPSHQIVERHHLPSVYTQTFRSVPSNLFSNNGAKYSAQIEQGAFTKIKSATLKIKITNTGTGIAQFAGVPHWFDRIEFRSGSKNLGIIYPDNLAFNLATLSQAQLKCVLPNANYRTNWSNDYNNSTRAGESITVYLPLLNTWLNNSEVYMRHLADDITIDFHPSSDITSYQAGSPVISCDDLQMIIQTEQLTGQDERQHEIFHKSVISSNRFLDVVPVNFYAKQLTAGQETKLELDSIHGQVAGMLVCVKPQGATNTNNGNFSYTNVGGTYDLLDAGSRSILGSGVPLDEKYLRGEIWAQHFNNDFSQRRNCVWIPFCESSVSAFHGKKDGYIRMDGERNYLAITPRNTAGVSPTIDFQVNEVATSGSFRVSFRGELSDSIPWDVTNTDLKDILEVMSAFKDSPVPLTVTVVGSPSTTTSTTITFDQKVDEDLVSFGIVQETLAGVSGLITATALVSPGVAGFISGAYDISLYAYVHSKLMKDTEGRLMVTTE